MFHIFSGKNKGNMTIGLALIASGIGVAVVKNKMEQNAQEVQKSQRQSIFQRLEEINTSSVTTAKMLLKAQTAGIYPDPYVPVSTASTPGIPSRDGPKKAWYVNANTLTVKDLSTKGLKTEFEDIMLAASKGKTTIPDATKESQLKVLGWDYHPSRPALITKAFFDLQTTSDNGQKIKAVATIDVPAPPPPQCQFRLTGSGIDVTNSHSGSTVKKSAKLKGNQLKAQLVVRCNNVVTNALVSDLYKSNKTVAKVAKNPKHNPYYTPANRITNQYAYLINQSHSLSYGNNALLARVYTVENAQQTYRIDIEVKQPITHQVCHKACKVLGAGKYPPVTSSTYYHKEYYQGKAPNEGVIVCYRSKKYYGFDGAKNCAGIGVVGSRGSEGCFGAETLVTMVDGSTKVITAIRPGERIFNPFVAGGVEVAEVVAGPEQDALFEITTEGGMVRVTKTHPFITIDGLVQARDLKVGEELLRQGGKTEKVLAIRQGTKKLETVWNIKIKSMHTDERQHLLIANGVITGDLYLQSQSYSQDVLQLLTQK